MLTVSLFVEFVRSRTVAVFWLAVLGQALLWTLVPVLFYSGPPAGVPELLAVAREFQLGSHLGPPLAHWVAEFVFQGLGLFGLYLLSQLCVVVALWSVFALGRRIVGVQHALLAVLLMAGVSALTVPTPAFGPGVLALALWSLALLHYWRAVGEGERRAWYWLGLEIGALLLTTYAGLALVGLLLLYTLMTSRGRVQLLAIEPWIAGAIAMGVFFPHLIWIDQAGGLLTASLNLDRTLTAWARVMAPLIVAHAGLIILVILGYGISAAARRGPAPVFARAPIDPAGRHFILFFALAPSLAIVLPALFTGRTEALVGAPLVVLSGLAVIAAAPDRIRIVHQRLFGPAWAALLVLPPLIVALAVTLLPWTLGTDLRVAQPTADIGRFFGESFERRTGRPLAIVMGDLRTASLVAMSAPGRPSVYDDAAPDRTPWLTPQDIAEHGAVVVWPASDTRGTPPPAIRERFPDLVPEVPRALQRRFQGRLPLLRIGWAVIRPRGAAP